MALPRLRRRRDDRARGSARAVAALDLPLGNATSAAACRVHRRGRVQRFRGLVARQWKGTNLGRTQELRRGVFQAAAPGARRPPARATEAPRGIFSTPVISTSSPWRSDRTCSRPRALMHCRPSAGASSSFAMTADAGTPQEATRRIGAAVVALGVERFDLTGEGAGTAAAVWLALARQDISSVRSQRPMGCPMKPSARSSGPCSCSPGLRTNPMPVIAIARSWRLPLHARL
jgi:hypothetical protein